MINRSRILICHSIVLAGFLAYASPAAAGPEPVRVKISELGAGKVSLTVTAAVTGEWILAIGRSQQGSCKSNLTAGTATTVQLQNDSQCGRLFTVDPENLRKADETEAVFELAPNAPIPIILEETDGSPLPGLDKPRTDWNQALADSSPLKGKTIWYYRDGWKTLDLSNPGDVVGHQIDIFVLMPSGAKPKEMTIDKPQPPPLTAEERARMARGQAEQDCKAERTKREDKGVNVLCFVYQGFWNRLPVGDIVMRPNKPLLVLAFAPPGTKVSIELTGDIGFADPKVRDEIQGRTTGSEFTPLLVNPREWPPLKPGAHTLTLTVKPDGKPDDVNKVDIVVDEPYAGAIRIGVGAIFGGARDRTYTVQMLPGSGQGEIVTTEGGGMDVELVLGVTAYLESGGRTYFTGERDHWSPYFGIGLLDKDNSGFEVLRSVHLGVEYEISKQFSIAGTVVGRRVDRLVDGLEVGDPLTGTAVPTRKGYEFGVAVVVNVSPEFLKISKSKMTGFFK